MSFQRIKHILRRLSIEEKALSIGVLTVMVSSFLPWHSIVFSNNSERNELNNGFTGDIGVIGFTVFALSALALLYTLSSHINLPLPRFRQKKEAIVMLLTGQSAFLLLLTMAIYTKVSFGYTEAGIRFGLYLALGGACLEAFSAYAQIQKHEAEEVEEIFGYKEERIEKAVAIKHETPVPSPAPAVERKINESDRGEKFFYREESEVSLPQEPLFEEPKEEGVSQANYFMKEAGIQPTSQVKVDLNSIKKIEKQDYAQESSNDSFYKDF